MADRRDDRAILLAWLKLLALDGDLAKAEPKTLRYRVLHAAARLVRGGRRAPPENPGDLAMGRGDHRRLAAHRRAPASPLTSTNPSLRPGKDNPGARGTPGHPARQPGHRHTPTLKSGVQNAAPDLPAPAINPDERSGLTALGRIPLVGTEVASAIGPVVGEHTFAGFFNENQSWMYRSIASIKDERVLQALVLRLLQGRLRSMHRSVMDLWSTERI